MANSETDSDDTLVFKKKIRMTNKNVKKRVVNIEQESDIPEKMIKITNIKSTTKSAGLCLDKINEINPQDTIDSKNNVSTTAGKNTSDRTLDVTLEQAKQEYIEQNLKKLLNDKNTSKQEVTKSVSSPHDKSNTPQSLMLTDDAIMSSLVRNKVRSNVCEDEKGERWLTGLNEVAVSIDDKLHNIERTEKARSDLILRREEELSHHVNKGKGDGSGNSEEGGHNGHNPPRIDGNNQTNAGVSNYNANYKQHKDNMKSKTKSRPNSHLISNDDRLVKNFKIQQNKNYK